MLDNFQQDNLETAEVMAIELLHQDNLPPLHRVYGHLVSSFDCSIPLLPLQEIVSAMEMQDVLEDRIVPN